MPSVISPRGKCYIKEICVIVFSVGPRGPTPPHLEDPRPHTGPVTTVTSRGKEKQVGFWLGSIEGESSSFLVIFPFYFNKEKVILPLKCNFKIQKMVESLAYFLTLRFSIRACTV